MKIVLRITPAALAIAGFVTVQTPSQAMPVQTALVEFGRDKDGALRRHGTTRFQNHLATLQLRPNSVCKGGTWHAASPADAPLKRDRRRCTRCALSKQQLPSFITMNKQRPVVRYLTLRSPRILLRCEGVFARVTRWPQRLLPRDHTEARMRCSRRHLMATANSRA
jgi:hypothetical protein